MCFPFLEHRYQNERSYHNSPLLDMSLWKKNDGSSFNLQSNKWRSIRCSVYPVFVYLTHGKIKCSSTRNREPLLMETCKLYKYNNPYSPTAGHGCISCCDVLDTGCQTDRKGLTDDKFVFLFGFFCLHVDDKTAGTSKENLVFLDLFLFSGVQP